MKTARMRNIIVGTAGHIDHGKTALVKALTGTDADRLAEEKRRGITIDLGFAHLQLTKDIRIGFIDVPGHERFVRNMLAGAAGIDLVLFVVAATESIKPQTREHFEICRMLGVKAGVIALTKSDLAEPELMELTRLEVDELVKGSFLENAPRVAVSSITGEGLPELRKEIECAARGIDQKKASGWFRLPLDRAFTMKGFGTVVTGTLISGTLTPEQEVEVYPIGRRLRIRGIQVYGEPATSAHAGERTAVNLAGIDPEGLHRGMVLSEAGRFAPVTILDCRVELLASAKPLKNRAPVHFHLGAAETEAEVSYLDKRPALKPGESTWARVTLKEPVLAFPDDRFIIRMFSPVITIGGGTVADISAHRYRRGEDTAARLRALTPERLVIETHWGISEDQLIAWTGLREIARSAGSRAGGEMAYFTRPECGFEAATHRALRRVPSKELASARDSEAGSQGCGDARCPGGSLRPRTEWDTWDGGSDPGWGSCAVEEPPGRAEAGRRTGADRDREFLRACGPDRSRGCRCVESVRSRACPCALDPADSPAGRKADSDLRRSCPGCGDPGETASSTCGKARPALQCTGVQGLDRRVAQIRDPSAGISGP